MSESEWVLYISCGYNTLQEVEELQHQLQGATDKNTKKRIQEEISITQAKRELSITRVVADSKEVR